MEKEPIGNEVLNYLNRFSENFGDEEKNETSHEGFGSYLMRFSDSFEGEKKEVETIFEHEIINPITDPKSGIDMGNREISSALDVDNKKMESSLGIVQSKFRIFRKCKSWKDVRKELGRLYKENIMVQTFALGVAMVVSPEVIPPLKYVVGPAMVKTGYSNSKFLQKKVKESLIENYVKIDYKKGRVTE
jgi:hypothetical protein